MFKLMNLSDISYQSINVFSEELVTLMNRFNGDIFPKEYIIQLIKNIDCTLNKILIYKSKVITNLSGADVIKILKSDFLKTYLIIY